MLSVSILTYHNKYFLIICIKITELKVYKMMPNATCTVNIIFSINIIDL